MRRCYIVIRFLSFENGGVFYEHIEDNPVREVFTDDECAKNWAYHNIQLFIDRSIDPLHIVEEYPDSEIIYKVGAFDTSGRCLRSYRVIKKGLML